MLLYKDVNGDDAALHLLLLYLYLCLYFLNYQHQPDRCIGVVFEDREAAVLLTKRSTNVRSHRMLHRLLGLASSSSSA